jgi:hypothetical protein
LINAKDLTKKMKISISPAIILTLLSILFLFHCIWFIIGKLIFLASIFDKKFQIKLFLQEMYGLSQSFQEFNLQIQLMLSATAIN